MNHNLTYEKPRHTEQQASVKAAGFLLQFNLRFLHILQRQWQVKPRRFASLLVKQHFNRCHDDLEQHGGISKAKVARLAGTTGLKSSNGHSTCSSTWLGHHLGCNTAHMTHTWISGVAGQPTWVALISHWIKLRGAMAAWRGGQHLFTLKKSNS